MLLGLGVGAWFLVRPSSTGPAQHVLFIGNSYTAVNSLPTLFQHIATSAGYTTPIVDSSTPGGETLAGHLKDTNTLKLIDSGAPDGRPWDVVVLQEQSETTAVAAVSPYVDQLFVSGVRGLYQRIKAHDPKAVVVLYETWSRDPALFAAGKVDTSFDGASAQEMQQRIRQSYQNAATSAAGAGNLPLPIAPVGDMWEQDARSSTPVPLYSSDGSHPNSAGSYLAGLVIFSTIYQTSVAKVTFAGEVPAAQANMLRALVDAQLSK